MIWLFYALKAEDKYLHKRAFTSHSRNGLTAFAVFLLSLFVKRQDKPASGVVDKSNTEVNTTKELSVYKDITKVNAKVKNDIIEVAGLKDKINELIEWYETKHKNVIEIPELKMEKRHFTGDVVVKSYRIYSDIVKKFETFSKKQDQYKIQDLVSQALLEFMEKYH